MVIITFNINNTDDDDAALTLSLKRTKKNAKLEMLQPFCFLFRIRHSIESGFATGLDNYLLLSGPACVCVCSFQPGIFTGWGNEEVNITKQHTAQSI